MAISTSTTATSANGQFDVDDRAAEAEPEAVAAHVVELRGVDPRVGHDHRESVTAQTPRPPGPRPVQRSTMRMARPERRLPGSRLRAAGLAQLWPHLPLPTPPLGRRARACVADAIESNWIAPLGPHVDAFEQELAAATGAEHARRALERHRRAPSRARRARDRRGRRGRVLGADVRGERERDRLHRRRPVLRRLRRELDARPEPARPGAHGRASAPAGASGP